MRVRSAQPPIGVRTQRYTTSNSAARRARREPGNMPIKPWWIVTRWLSPPTHPFVGIAIHTASNCATQCPIYPYLLARQPCASLHPLRSLRLSSGSCEARISTMYTHTAENSCIVVSLSS